MKIRVRPGMCSGHARCAAVAPDLFALDEDGYIAFTEKEVPAGQEAAALRGVRACPERALFIDEDPGTSS